MDAGAWADRIAKVRSGGTAAIADMAMARFLAPDFVKAHPETAQSIRRGLTGMSANGYAGAGAAIRDMALIDRLPGLTVPMLIVAGNRDISTPFAGHGEHIAAAVPGARVVRLDTAHLAPMEAPAALAAALRDFLAPSPGAEAAAATLYEAGLSNRRRVLGDAWVDRSLANRTDFNSEFQAMITRIAWQGNLEPPRLDERTRRLLVLAITAALGRWRNSACMSGPA